MSCRNENDVQRRVSDSRKEYLLYEKWRRSITANWGYRHIRWLSLQSLRARNYYIGTDMTELRLYKRLAKTFGTFRLEDSA